MFCRVDVLLEARKLESGSYDWQKYHPFKKVCVLHSLSISGLFCRKQASVASILLKEAALLVFCFFSFFIRASVNPIQRSYAALKEKKQGFFWPSENIHETSIYKIHKIFLLKQGLKMLGSRRFHNLWLFGR